VQQPSCIDACDACAAACDRCASACLRAAPAPALARCVELGIDCAQVCRLASSLMARGSTHAPALCALAALICDACADECARHAREHAHCRACAQACTQCAAECRRMAGMPAQDAPLQPA
jgi:hypothetical protein